MRVGKGGFGGVYNRPWTGWAFYRLLYLHPFLLLSNQQDCRHFCAQHHSNPPNRYSSPRLMTSTTMMTSPLRVEYSPVHDDPEKASPASQEEIPPHSVRSWLARQFRHHFELFRLWLVGQFRNHSFRSAIVLCLTLVGITAGLVHWSYGYGVSFAERQILFGEDGVSFSLISLAPIGFEPMRHIVGRTPWT